MLCHRGGERRIFLETGKTYFSPLVDNINIIDPHTKKRRRFVASDAKKMATVMDYTRHMDVVQVGAFADDLPPEIVDRVNTLEMMLHQRKAISFSPKGPEALLDIIEMAAIVAGGKDELRLNPYVMKLGEPISPLLSDFHAMDKLMYNARHGIPQVYTPCCIGGATVPATHAGQLVCAFSESMLGVVVAQLLNPGTCVIMGGVQSIMDMQYSVYAYGSPELSLMSAALTEMAQYAGLPMFSTAGCTDTKILDAQGAIEAATSVHSAMLSGANFIHDVGYFESGMTGSVLQLVMADEQIGMSHVVAKGIEINEEALAVEEICQVGPGGDYRDRDHTQKHAAALWTPTLMDRQNYEDWAAQGQTTMRDRVIAKARDIIANFEGPLSKVPPEAKKKIEDILQAAEEREARKAAADKKAG